jgi:hypothetical protein
MFSTEHSLSQKFVQNWKLESLMIETMCSFVLKQGLREETEAPKKGVFYREQNLVSVEDLKKSSHWATAFYRESVIELMDCE